MIYISRLNGHPIESIFGIKNYNFIKSHNHKAVITSLGTASATFSLPPQAPFPLPTIYNMLGSLTREKHCQHQYLAAFSKYIFFCLHYKLNYSFSPVIPYGLIYSIHRHNLSTFMEVNISQFLSFPKTLRVLSCHSKRKERCQLTRVRPTV